MNAIPQALSIFDQSQGSGHRYTVFVDSTVAIYRVRSDGVGRGQRFAIASVESCARILARGNEVAIKWVPVHQGVFGSEKADEYAGSAAEWKEPDSAVPDEYR